MNPRKSKSITRATRKQTVNGRKQNGAPIPVFCLFCIKPIEPGQSFTKQVSPDGIYSIAVHDACQSKRG